MSKRKYSEVEMIGALKQMEAGRTAADVGRELGVSKHTIYAWKAKYGGMSVGEAQRLRQLEDENGRLKKLVMDCAPRAPGPAQPKASMPFRSRRACSSAPRKPARRIWTTRSPAPAPDRKSTM